MADPLINSDMLRRLEQLTVVSRRMASGMMRGERRSRQRGQSTDFADYRNYVVGDDLRYLDWKIYARLEKLFIKLFLEEEDLRVNVLVDTSPSMATGSPEKLHYAKQVAAALGYVSLAKNDSVSAHGFSGGVTASFGPKRGKVSARRYFDFLDKLVPDGQTDISAAMHDVAMRARGRGVVIVISDFMDFNGFEAGLRALFGRNFEVLVIHTLSPEELEPELAGDVRLVDVEFGMQTDISVGRSLMEGYKKTVKVFCDGIREYTVNRGGNYVLTSTALPFDRLVLDVLCRKGMLR